MRFGHCHALDIFLVLSLAADGVACIAVVHGDGLAFVMGTKPKSDRDMTESIRRRVLLNKGRNARRYAKSHQRPLTTLRSSAYTRKVTPSEPISPLNQVSWTSGE